MSNPLKIGHRGAKAYVLENTLESFKKALSMGADGVELDVHKCSTGELVVFHDFTLDRLTNFSGEISNFSLLELKKMNLENGFKIPTLIEVLDVVKGSSIINIELKGKNTASETLRIIKMHINNNKATYNNFLVSSFLSSELETIFKINTNINLAVLCETNLQDALAFASTIKAKAINANVNLLSKKTVNIIKNLGFKVNVWTVNEIDEIKRMKRYQVDGIISDFPDRL